MRGVKEWKCVSRDGKREQECARKNRVEGREENERYIEKEGKSVGRGAG